MTSGILLGLTAAVCWGIADFCARGASRALGTFRALLGVNLVGASVLLILAAPLGVPARLAVASPGAIWAAVAINLAILAGAGLLYRAFAIGTLALVSPIAASFAALTALLSLASGEHPTTTQVMGIVLALGGVILASTVPGHPDAAPAGKPFVWGAVRLAPGLLEAFGSLVVFGVAYWALRFVVVPLGSVTVAFLGKMGDLAVLAVFTLAIALRAQKRSPRLVPILVTPAPLRRTLLVYVMPTALLDTGANIAYNLGITTALTSVVSVLSSLFSAVTVLLAAIFLRERLSRWQLFGACLIFTGIVLVSI